MKSRLVKELKDKYNVRRIAGKKTETYSFYDLCYYLKLAEQGEVLK